MDILLSCSFKHAFSVSLNGYISEVLYQLEFRVQSTLTKMELADKVFV
jgi:hypothetical protein